MTPKPATQGELLNLTADQKQGVYELLETELNKQITAVNARLEEARLMGNKAWFAEAAKDKLKLERDLQMVLTYKTCPDVIVPKFHWERRKRRYELTFPYLKETELEVQVMQGLQLQPPPDMTTMSPFIALEIGYPSEKPQKILTSTSKPESTDGKTVKFPFGFSHRFAIRLAHQVRGV
eukprot:EC716699.1.p1 GENE.EC716699.1~~EC716699.1.p1  ORF type:complete len:179 (+),score=15.38 EC716699.1:190-726(+)